MEVMEAIAQRASVRSYRDEAVDRADLERIVEAGHLAPSGYNKQPWHFLVLTERDDVRAVGRAMASDWVASAPALIAVVVDDSSRFWLEDGAAAIENILLAATDLGYGSCWVGGGAQFNEDSIKLTLNIPANLRVQAVVTIGRPAEWQQHEKRPLSEVLTWGKWA